jgi:HEXXH motif-containing protein
MAHVGLLALPSKSDRTVGTLRRKVGVLALGALLKAQVSGASPAMARSLVAARRAVMDAARRDRVAVLDAVVAPDVLPPLLCIASGIRPASEMLALAVPNLLLALQEVVRTPVVWDVPIQRLAYQGRHFDLGATGMLANHGRPEVRMSGGAKLTLDSLSPETEDVALNGPSLHFSTVDANPLFDVEEHPDKFGNAVSMGGRETATWVEALNQALGLVKLGLPTWFEELEGSLDRIVPVGYEPERHNSASYREAPGLCYVTLHPDPMTMAEALVHETQHGKLNLLSWIDPVLDNAFTAWTESPVRPDLRPVWGVLLAVHAFVPVAALHRSLADAGHPLAATPQFARRRADVLAGNARGLSIMKEKAEPTKLGRRVLQALYELHDELVAVAPPPPHGVDPSQLPPS